MNENYIVGIDKTRQGLLYRVLQITVTSTGAVHVVDAKRVPATVLIRYLQSNNAVWRNVGLKDGKIVGTTGSLSRFTDGGNLKPCVLLSSMETKEGEVKGYRVANFDGAIKAMPIKEVGEWCKRCAKRECIPFQNAIYKGETQSGAPIIALYPNQTLAKEIIGSSVNSQAQLRKPDLKKNRQNLAKMEKVETSPQVRGSKTLPPFSQEQQNFLKKMKAKGVNPIIMANPDLTVSKMTILGDAATINEKEAAKFAFPEYGMDAMGYLGICVACNVDITPFLNPAYSSAQMTEIAAGIQSGVDINKYSNPANSPLTMSEIRIRLETETWADGNTEAITDWGTVKEAKSGRVRKNKVAVTSE